jgi:YHS domain-containing protein
MKKLRVITFFILVAMAWLHCSTPQATWAINPINASPDGVAIDGYDPVAYFTEGKALEGSTVFTYEWMGAQWRFASTTNLELFKSDPSKYAPQYGGY